MTIAVCLGCKATKQTNMAVNSVRRGFLCNNSGLQIYGNVMTSITTLRTCNDKTITFYDIMRFQSNLNVI